MTRIRKPGKRTRLIEATDIISYQTNFASATLAKIADAAEVPLGNVYYYFKTKEAIIAGLIAKRSKELQALFEDWEALSSVHERLDRLIHYFSSQAEEIARYGCAIGGLCQELCKQGDKSSGLAATLMAELLQWVETQFELAGKGTAALGLAEQLVAALEGMALLSLSLHDPHIMIRQSQRLSQWLREQVGQAALLPEWTP